MQRDACDDFHRLLQNCLTRSDCDLSRCRIEMAALHNCCAHGFQNTSRYCYWKVQGPLFIFLWHADLLVA